MESDPEWEKTVMNKVKEYYTGDRAAGSTQNRYQTPVLSIQKVPLPVSTIIAQAIPSARKMSPNHMKMS